MAEFYLSVFRSRIVTIIMAFIVIVIAIFTVKLIDSNEAVVKEYDDIALNEEFQDLQSLIILTQAAANWAFVLCSLTIFAGVISIILSYVSKQPTSKLIIEIIEMILMCLGMLCFLSLGIASAVHASSWGGPLDACERIKELIREDLCHSKSLTLTNGLQAVVSFVEIAILGAEVLVTIFSVCCKDLSPPPPML